MTQQPDPLAPPDRPERHWLWDESAGGYWFLGSLITREELQWLLTTIPVAVPARAHQEEKEDENEDVLSRVDGERLSERQELPRKSPTGDSRRCDQLLNNLRGCCAFGGTCGTMRTRGEFCTPCEAAARLEEADEALRLIVCECECWQADACSQSVVGRAEAARAALTGRR